jgi:hypothetical protein
MARHVAISISLMLFVVSGLGAQRTEVSTAGSRQAFRGAPENFTGTVSVTPLFAAAAGTHATGAQVTFEPGARSAWHRHPPVKRSSLPAESAGCRNGRLRNGRSARGM